MLPRWLAEFRNSFQFPVSDGKKSSEIHRPTGRGGGGAAGGRQLPQFRKILKFFGQNAHDSGKSTWDK